MVDKAIDGAISWIVGKAKSLFAKLFGRKNKDNKTDERTIEDRGRDAKLARDEAQLLLSNPDHKIKDIQAGLPTIKTKYRLTSIVLEDLGNNEYDILVVINPGFKTAPKKVATVLPPGLVPGIYIKLARGRKGELEIWKVDTIDSLHVNISHATNIKDIRKFDVDIFSKKFLDGEYLLATEEEKETLKQIDPKWETKFDRSHAQKTNTPGHAELMIVIAEREAKKTTTKRIYLDRQYRTITELAANKLTYKRRPDVVVEHKTGRLDIRPQRP
jgi:hypothetical protein